MIQSFSPILANFANKFLREVEVFYVVNTPKIQENRKLFFDPVFPELSLLQIFKRTNIHFNISNISTIRLMVIKANCPKLSVIFYPNSTESELSIIKVFAYFRFLNQLSNKRSEEQPTIG